MNNAEVEKLMSRNAQYQKGIQNSVALIGGIETEGFIDGFRKGASVRPKSILTRLSLVEGNALTRAQVLDEAVPNYLTKLKGVIDKKRAAIGEINFQLAASYEPETPQEPNKEILTMEDAAMLGALVMNRNNVFININGLSFTWRIEPEVLNICQNLASLPMYSEVHSVQDENKIQFIQQKRAEFLEKLKKQMDGQTNLQIDPNVPNERKKKIELLIIWLHEQNENNFYGSLPNFLETPETAFTRPTITDRKLFVQSTQRIWKPEPEVLKALKIRRLSRRIQVVRERRPVVLPTEKLAVATQKEVIKTPKDAIFTEEEAILALRLMTNIIKDKDFQDQAEDATNLLLREYKNPNSPIKDKTDYLILRASALKKLEIILNSSLEDQASFTDAQKSEALQSFAALLYLGKEVILGFKDLFQDLKTPNWKASWRAEKGDQYIFLLELEKNAKAAQESFSNPNNEAIQTLEDATLVKTEDGLDNLSVELARLQEEAKRSKASPRREELLRRDPNIIDTIYAFVKEVDARITTDLSFRNQINRVFQGLKVSVFERLIEQGLLTPAGNREFPQYSRNDIVLMQYVESKRRGGGFQRRYLSALKEIITEQFARLETEKAQKKLRDASGK